MIASLRTIQRIFKSNKKKIVFLVFLVIILLVGIGLHSYLYSKDTHQTKTVENFYQACTGDFKWRVCYAKKFEIFIKQRSVYESIEVLDELQKKDKKLLSCHEAGHAISVGELNKKEYSWVELAKWVDVYRCSNGFFHGLLEGLLAKDKVSLDEISLGNFCQNVEENFKGVKMDLITNCYHVVGHSLILTLGGDIDAAIKICSKFKDEVKSYFCHSGVFMEEFVRTGMVDHGIKPPLKYNWESVVGEEEICRRYQSPIAETCWREIATIYISLAGNYPPKVFENCARAGSQKYQGECYRYAVYLMVFGSYYKDADEKTLCDPLLGDEEAYKLCIKGEVIAFNGTKNSVERADNLCNAIPVKYKEYCNEVKRDWYGGT